MKNEKGFTVIELVIVLMFVVIIPLAVTGWVKNLIKLSECDFESPYKAEVIRVVGVIPPVGAVVGWLNIED